ncbi:conserved hypothetical protein [Burkholderiales bacterium 8X]|nr:conserved hypothetical protein [Burkholderiales bacterium 8X]
MSHPSSPRFFNPLMLWLDVALKTQEMWLSSGSVIQHRMQRMARHGLTPSPEDLAEIQLMSHEKLMAAGESSAAIANQLHTTQFTLMNRAARQWVAGASAWVALSTNANPAELASHVDAIAEAANRSAATLSQISSAGARIVQRGIKPILSKTTENAKRLSLATPPER